MINEGQVVFVTRVRAAGSEASMPGGRFQSKDVDRVEVPQGSVLLFDAEHDPLEPANHFLRSHCRVEKSIRTQNAYADDLSQWWTYLGRNGLVWNEVDLDQLDAYAAYLSRTVSPTTGRHYASATVRRRIVTIEMFYHWAHGCGLIPKPIIHAFSGTRPSSPGPRQPTLVHGRRRAGRVKIPRKADPHDNVDIFQEHELRAVLSALGPDPLSPNHDRPVRDRLIAEVAVSTGMRIAEVCALATNQIEAAARIADISSPDDLLPIRLTKTKGGKKRVVYLRCDLWNALLGYIKGERQASVDCAVEAATARGERFADRHALFVNGAKANKRDVGRPVTTDTVSRTFRRAVLNCGLAKTVAAYVVDPSTGRPMIDGRDGRHVTRDRTVAEHSFHHLRHTFAVHVYRADLKLKRPVPLKKLQLLLGHASMSTTMDVYLRHCDPDLVALEEAYAEKLRRLADG